MVTYLNSAIDKDFLKDGRGDNVRIVNRVAIEINFILPELMLLGFNLEILFTFLINTMQN